MNEKFNKFLLGILWTTVSTLALCFWLNINFGFNLLSAAHWRHLAYMQASQQPVKTIFYVSLIIGFSFIILGLYVLIRPNLRRIKLIKKHKQKKQPETSQPETPVVTTPSISESARPPIITNNRGSIDYSADIPPAPVVGTTYTHNKPQSERIEITDSTIVQDYPEITQIFQDAGYTIKEPTNIGAFCPALIAIGNNTTLWVGAVEVGTNAVQGIIDAFSAIFRDTLEDIEINIHGFVVNATDADAPKSSDIMLFKTIDDLRDYMQDHRNTPDEDDPDGEGFEAYSNYISTVIKHLGTF